MIGDSKGQFQIHVLQNSQQKMQQVTAATNHDFVKFRVEMPEKT